MNIFILSILLLPYLEHCQAQDDESTKPRLLSNQNTAAVTGAAIGLGIGVLGSVLVGKLIEDATKCKPQNTQPPAFGRFLPDLLNLNPGPCKSQYTQQNHYRQPQSYPSSGYQVPGYQTPSASNKHKHQQTVDSGYSIPAAGYQVQGYQTPSASNEHKYQQTVDSGYSIPASGYQVQGYQTTVASSQNMYQHIQAYANPNPGYSIPKQTYNLTPTNQNYFSQTAPHKASVDAPKDAIVLVNTDYKANEYTYSPNSAIQPRNIGQDDLFKPIQALNQRQPKAFTPINQLRQKTEKVSNAFTQTAPHKAKPNSPDNKLQREPKAFTPVSQARQKTEKVSNTFTQTAPHKAQANSPDTHKEETREAKQIGDTPIFSPTDNPDQRQPKAFTAFTPVSQARQKKEKVSNTFTQTAAHKAQPNSPDTNEKDTREAKQISHKSIFSQTEAHKPEPNNPNTSSRQGKTLSSQTKLSVSNYNQPKFQPLPESRKQFPVKTEAQKPTPASFLRAFNPVSDSSFAPSPIAAESSFEPTQSIIIARKPKLFGGRVRFESTV